MEIREKSGKFGENQEKTISKNQGILYSFKIETLLCHMGLNTKIVSGCVFFRKFYQSSQGEYIPRYS